MFVAAASTNEFLPTSSTVAITPTLQWNGAFCLPAQNNRSHKKNLITLWGRYGVQSDGVSSCRGECDITLEFYSTVVAVEYIRYGGSKNDGNFVESKTSAVCQQVGCIHRRTHHTNARQTIANEHNL